MNKENDIKIKVLGVGGGGSNAVATIIEQNVQNIEPYIINTEMSIVSRTHIRRVLQIGRQTTNGLGAGANEKVGERAAIESKEEIKQLLQGTDLLFVTAGMGGGTGTGAAPVVAQIAKEMGIPTIGIVTKPFAFEGKLRTIRANNGIEKLKENVNA